MVGDKEMGKRVITVCATLILACTVVWVQESMGADWKYVSTAGDGNYMLYDPQSLVRLTYDLVNVRVKYRTAVKYEIMNYAYSISLVKIDCARKKLTSEKISDYDREGRLIGTVTSPGDPWYPISADSLYYSLYDAVCEEISLSRRGGRQGR